MILEISAVGRRKPTNLAPLLSPLAPPPHSRVTYSRDKVTVLFAGADKGVAVKAPLVLEAGVIYVWGVQVGGVWGAKERLVGD